jgi:hypothetical protein
MSLHAPPRGWFIASLVIANDQESAERGNSSDTVDAESIVSRDRSAPEATAC